LGRLVAAQRAAEPPIRFTGSQASGAAGFVAAAAPGARLLRGGLVWSLLWTGADVLRLGHALAEAPLQLRTLTIGSQKTVAEEEPSSLSAGYLAALAALPQAAAPPAPIIFEVALAVAGSCGAGADAVEVTAAVALSPGAVVYSESAGSSASADHLPRLALRVQISIGAGAGAAHAGSSSTAAACALRSVLWQKLSSVAETLAPAPRRSLLVRTLVGPAALEALGHDCAEHKDCIDI